MSGSHVFVLLILLIVFSSGLIKAWMSRRDDRSMSEEEAEDMLGKIDTLEERIQVLEKIITDNRFDLKREIDRL